MRDGDIDYSKYTLRELEEALAGINRDRYPKNYDNLRAAHARMIASLPPAPQVEPEDDFLHLERNPPPQPRYDANGRYVPNQIPANARNQYIAFSLLLGAYGTYGVWVNDLYMPARRGSIHLHDAPAWVMYGAILCACLVMLSVVADHYDRRDNEIGYRLFADVFKVIGWILFGLSLIFSAIRQADA